MRVAVATCAEHAQLDAEGRLVLDALRARGCDATAAVWDDPGVDWTRCDAVLVRSTWDYTMRLDAFLAWTRAVGARLHNGADVIAWNADKRYLFELEAAGIAVVGSEHLAPGDTFVPPPGRFVVKPTVSAGSIGTALFDATRHAAARAHVAALHDAGRHALVQPFYARVDSDAETAVVFIDGAPSHGMRKEPLLTLDRPPAQGLYYPEQMRRREPAADVVALAQRACGYVGERFGEPLYARVDVLRDDDGAPLVLELELIEPSLFLDFAPGSARSLADALLRRLSR